MFSDISIFLIQQFERPLCIYTFRHRVSPSMSLGEQLPLRPGHIEQTSSDILLGARSAEIAGPAISADLAPNRMGVHYTLSPSDRVSWTPIALQARLVIVLYPIQ